MNTITIKDMTVATFAASTKQHIIAFEVIGPSKVERARQVCSLIEAALKSQNIEVQYDDVHPGFFALEAIASYGVGDKPTAQEMERIAFQALRAVKTEYDRGTSLGESLAEVTQRYETRAFSDDDDQPDIDATEHNRPRRVYRMGSSRRPERITPDDDEPAPKPSLKDQVTGAFRTVIDSICKMASECSDDLKNHPATRQKAAEVLADQILALPEENRTEDNILKLAKVGLTALCEAYEIKKTADVNGTQEDKTEGFISWQAMEAKSKILDILAAGPDGPRSSAERY